MQREGTAKRKMQFMALLPSFSIAFMLKRKGGNIGSSTADDFLQSMINIFIAVLLLHLSACNAGDPCPPRNQMGRCTCTQEPVANQAMWLSPIRTTPTPVTTPETRAKRDTARSTPIRTFGNGTFYTVVECKVPKSIQVLEEVVSAFNRKMVDKLIVTNVPSIKGQNLTRLPNGWLKKIRVRQFEISNSKLSGDFIWYGDPFIGQEKSLLWFSASNCLLVGSLTHNTAGTVHTRGLNNLPLLGLDLSNNLITVITAMSFRYPPANLSTVILSRNSIQLIEVGTFYHTPFLRHVDLSRNLLEKIPRNVFASPARHLEHIDLSWNSLTALSPDFFANMPALKVVNVSNNFLYSMPEKPWGIVFVQLTHIDITNNFVACNCDLMWLPPILSPAETNDTSTPAPKPLPGQTILGYCSKTVEPWLFAVKYDLSFVTKDRLVC